MHAMSFRILNSVIISTEFDLYLTFFVETQVDNSIVCNHGSDRIAQFNHRDGGWKVW